MTRRQLIIYIIDLVILSASYLVMAAYKPSSRNYLSDEYVIAFVVLLVIWTTSSLYFRKYRMKKKNRFSRWLRNILLPNFISLGVVAVFIILFQVANYSRLILFGTIGLATMAELFLGNIYYLLLNSSSNGTKIKNPPLSAREIKIAKDATNFREPGFSAEAITDAIETECGKGAFDFMSQYVDIRDPKTLFLSTSTRFNVEFQPSSYFSHIVNLKRVNDIQFINKFFESVNRKLPADGLFIGCAETKDARKERILKKFPPVINWIFYTFDFIVKRLFPKFILTRRIYFILTRGMNRVISRAEILGRLYSCGFEVEDECFIANLYFFAVKKKKQPCYDHYPSYGPFVKLNRIGKGGKWIRVYKFRTMHPYAEYLQEYIYKKNNLQVGGKFKNDFRISSLGKLLRRFWLDELPMLLNVLKGEMKIVGVRPLSQHYFDLYSKELRDKRILYKPGLIPPFYADLPKTLEEIQESEMRYLESFEKKPFRTDCRYFRKAFVNIVFKNARSR